jgi:4-hydroxybenzoate polyprenyltransferase
MILLFVSMNGAFGSKISGVSWINPHLAIVIPLILSFFFRMRLFDEIKDYKTDINVNPTRPLPRGLLRINQVKKMILALMLIELPLAASMGLPVFAAYVMGLCFSLLMYNEFFLSDFLRDKLTTYAVSHTFVSIILGMITSFALVGSPSTLSMDASFGFFLSNWALFNLFEFARKSFAPSEERENVPTYSGLFGIKGAWALSMSQILLTHAALYLATQSWNITFAGITLTYIILSLYYVISGSEKSAVFFRLLTSVVLLLSEISILYWLR